MSTLTKVIDEALALSSDDRAILAHRVLESMAPFASPEVEEAWMAVAERRWREIQSGSVPCVSLDEAMRKARHRLNA